MEVVTKQDQRFLKHKGKFYGYCHCCHKFGHKVADCRTKGKDQSLRRKQDTNTSNDRRPISRVPHGNMWRINSNYKGSEETQNSNISEVCQDDGEHNSSIDKNDIHYEGKKDEYVKEYTDGDEDDNISHDLEENPEISIRRDHILRGS